MRLAIFQHYEARDVRHTTKERGRNSQEVKRKMKIYNCMCQLLF